MKLEIIEPSNRDSAILVCDEDHNDIAEFYHNEHATVGQSYETALMLARLLVDAADRLEICECGFPTDVCATNKCYRKQVHLAGLTPDSQWPKNAPIGCTCHPGDIPADHDAIRRIVTMPVDDEDDPVEAMERSLKGRGIPI